MEALITSLETTDPRRKTRAEEFKKNSSNKTTDLKAAGYITYITDGMTDECNDNATFSFMGKKTFQVNIWLSEMAAIDISLAQESIFQHIVVFLLFTIFY